MEGDYSTGQNPQWAVVPVEEEEEEEEEGGGGEGEGGGGGGGEEEEEEEECCVQRTIMDLFLNDPLIERDLLH